MVDNIKTVDKDNVLVTLAAKDVGGVYIPVGTIADPAGNAVDFSVAKGTGGGVKMTLQDPLSATDLQIGTLNNTWLLRTDGNQEFVFSASRFLTVASVQVAFDGVRTTAQGTGSLRRVALPTDIVQLDANTTAVSYQGAIVPARVFRIFGNNSDTAVQYLKLWDRNNAPTIGTDAPKWIRRLPVGDFDIDLAGLCTQSGLYYTFHTTRGGTTLTTAGKITDFGIIKG